VKWCVFRLKNFGFVNEATVVDPGTNGKMSELHAAFGLANLKNIDASISRRLKIDEIYRQNLACVPGISLLPPKSHATQNGSYFPIFVDSEEFGMSRDVLYEKLKKEELMVRRYFYPLISQFEMYRHLPRALDDTLQNANVLTSQVICLPIYEGLETDIANLIVELIRQSQT
jgi:dTDP-4-amino-4,6-dideoxygalactose transaminase